MGFPSAANRSRKASALNKWNTTQYGAGYWPQSNYFYIYDVRYTTGETYCA